MELYILDSAIIGVMTYSTHLVMKGKKTDASLLDKKMGDIGGEALLLSICALALANAFIKPDVSPYELTAIQIGTLLLIVIIFHTLSHIATNSFVESAVYNKTIDKYDVVELAYEFIQSEGIELNGHKVDKIYSDIVTDSVIYCYLHIVLSDGRHIYFFLDCTIAYRIYDPNTNTSKFVQVSSTRTEEIMRKLVIKFHS